MDIESIREAGLTEGEAKVYLALLELGSSTTGPIVAKAKVANSIIYRILESLIEKGLVSYITKDKTKYFQAAEPQKILDFIEERKGKLDESKDKINVLLPQLTSLMHAGPESSVRLFEGFKGIQTAWELMYTKLKRGEEYHCYGVYPYQEERFHLYWQRDHLRRIKHGIKMKSLFNQGTDIKILQNRNSFKGNDVRYMPTDVKTPAWFATYKDVTVICLQHKKPMMILIINQEVADSFEAYFQDFWKRTKPIK